MNTAETAVLNEDEEQNKQITTYYEKKIGKTLFRVTNVYKGETPLAVKLEDLIINKVLFDEDFEMLRNSKI